MFVRVIVDRLGFPNEERESMFVRGIVDRLGFLNEEREHVCSRDCRLIGIHERREREEPRILMCRSAVVQRRFS